MILSRLSVFFLCTFVVIHWHSKKRLQALKIGKIQYYQIKIIIKRMKDLEVYVGLCIKVGNVYGVCDKVCGDRIGFVWSDKDSWTGQMVDAKDVTICETEKDCERGRLSALHYFEREVNSLQLRIKMGRKQDDLTTLVNELSRCEYWLSRLS